MGASSSSPRRQVLQPEQIGEFRKNSGFGDTYVIPEVPQKRRVTDLKFTIALGVCLVLLVPFLIYTFVQSDLDRVVHGYDKCGNVCGEKNSVVEGISCSGQDMTNLPFLRLKKVSRSTQANTLLMDSSDFEDNSIVKSENGDSFIRDECVEKCASGYVEIFNRCFPGERLADDEKDIETLLADVGRDINKSAGYIVLLCFIGLGLCVGMLFLFRYFVAVVVWVILIGSLLGIIALAGVFWYLRSTDKDTNNAGGWQFLAIFFTVLAIILTIVLICLFKKIKLVIRLFKEAIKVIFGVPVILFEPLLTFVAVGVLLLVAVFFLIFMSTAGILQKSGFDLYEYFPNGAIIFTIFFHVITCLWMYNFIIGCQHIVISGAVSAYYFARDKATLASPLYTSFYNLVRYHIGSISFGSLIITVVALIRALIRGLVSNKQARAIVDCCLEPIEQFLKYLTKNAYILTAMHGEPFFKSGKRAARLLAANAMTVIAINSVGDFVLFMSKVLIIVCTIIIGTLMADSNIENFWAAILISVIVTAVIADCFFTVFETAIDTIFLCYCEDSCMNDGMERPYYMSTNLMQYMDEAKKTIKEKN